MHLEEHTFYTTSGEEVYYQVIQDGYRIGDIYQDSFGGWRPYNHWGNCLTNGRSACITPEEAMGYFKL